MIRKFDSDMSFEKAMSEMEAVVSELESTELPLEKSIELFELGMSLSLLCNEKLQQAENKIQTLIATKDGFTLKDVKAEEE